MNQGTSEEEAILSDKTQVVNAGTSEQETIHV
jgi:hypothetical protein